MFRIHPSPWIAVGVLFWLTQRIHCQEPVLPLEIQLGSGVQDDSRLEFILPVKGSPDKMDFQEKGISIKLVSQAGKESKTLGLKLLAGSKSHFAFMVDLECLRLDPSKSGWGQGILFRVVTEDPQAPVMAFGYASTPKMRNAFISTLNYTESRKQEFIAEPLSFSKGRWLIERKDDQLLVSIDESGSSFRQIKRLTCTTAPVREFHVVCARQETGNGPVEVKLNSLMFIGDQFLSQPQIQPSFWNRWTLGGAGILFIVTGVAIYALKRKLDTPR